MNIRELIRMMLLQFFICYTCTMGATVFFCRLNTPPVTTLELSYLWQVGIFSVFAVLPGAVYYTRKELNEKQWKQRTILHTILLVAVLMIAGHWIHMYEGLLGAFLFFISILVIDCVVRGLTYLADQKVADAINLQLQKKRGKEE